MEHLFAELADGKLDINKPALPGYMQLEEPPINRSEALRYAGIPYSGRGQDGQNQSMTEELLEECLTECKGKLKFQIAYTVEAITVDEAGYPQLSISQHSDNLKKNLEGCVGVMYFAATVGAGIDQLIRRYERISPAKALMLQGIGAERVESLCNAFCDIVIKEAMNRGFGVRPRYSPGYGDLPINVQPQLLSLVNAEKRLGVTLSDSYLMAPSKSVTAIIGFEKRDSSYDGGINNECAENQSSAENKCSRCQKTDCEFRQR